MLETHNLRKREFATVGVALCFVGAACLWVLLHAAWVLPSALHGCWWLSVHAKLAADGLQARMLWL